MKKIIFAFLILTSSIFYAEKIYADDASTNTLNKDGVALFNAGDYSAALEKFLEAEKTANGKKTYALSTTYKNLSIVYEKLEDKNNSALYLSKQGDCLLELSSLKMYQNQRTNILRNAFNAYGSSSLKFFSFNLEESLVCRKKQLEILSLMGESESLDAAKIYNYIGVIQGKSDIEGDALESYKKAVEIAEKKSTRPSKDLANYYNNVSICYKNLNNSSDADFYRMKAAAEYAELALKERDEKKRAEFFEKFEKCNAFVDLDSLKARHSDVFYALCRNAGNYYLENKNYSGAYSFFIEAGSFAVATGNYKMITEFYSLCYEIAQVHFPNVAYSFLQAIALSYIELGEYEKSYEVALKAIDVCTKKLGENDTLTAECHKTLARYYLAKNDYRNAITSYEKAYSIFKNLNQEESFSAMTCLSDLGFCCMELNDFERAYKNFSIVKDFYERTQGSNYSNLANIYSNFGIIELRKKNWGASIKFFNKAKEIAELNFESNNYIFSVVNNNLGHAYGEMGDHARAIGYHTEALKNYKELYGEESASYALCLELLGVEYYRSKNFEKAEECFTRGLEISLKASGKYHNTTFLFENALGAFYQECVGKIDFEKAGIHLENALDIAREIYGENNLMTATAYQNIGALSLYHNKDYKKTVEYCKKAIDIEKNILGEENPALAVHYDTLGFGYSGLEDANSAVKAWMKSLELYKNSIEYDKILNSCWWKVRDCLNSDDCDYLTRKAIETATIAVERSRTGLVGAIKNSILEKASPFYYAGISLELKKNNMNIAKAFDYSEGLRSRGFLDQIGSEAALNLPGIAPADAAEMRRLEREVFSQREELNNYLLLEKSSRDEKKLNLLIKNIEKNEKALAAFEKKLAAQNPKYSQLKNPVPATLGEAQKFCKKNQAIVEFVLWNEEYDDSLEKDFVYSSVAKINSYAIVIMNKKSFAVKLDEFDYADSVSSLREKILGLKDEKEFEAERNVLYEKLLQNVLEKLPDEINSLLIVPDGSLAFLPFDILRKNSKSKQLGEIYELSFSPSVSISILKNSEKANSSNRPILAIGGGWYDRELSASEHRGNYSGKAVRAKNRGVGGGEKKQSLSETSGLSEAELREFIREKGAGAYFKDISLLWSDLPGTLREVRDLESQVFSSKQINLVTQDSVTEKNLKSLSENGKLASYLQIHLACHGYFDSKIPEMSSVVFSEVSLSGEGEDGYLTVPEILRLNLNSDFVCLSACETGLGRVKVGDGITGLSRAFMVSGSKKVGVTLWSVDDDATCAFMVRLYKKIREGVPYSTAYFDVRSEFIKEKKWNHPYYRSAFVLYE